MRRLIVAASAVGLACASMAAPPGGPRRTEPPVILAISPESGAVNVSAQAVVVTFDAIVNDRAGRGGALAGSVLLSPNDGGTEVRWRRDRIDVRPKRGFRPGTAYTLTILPGIADLNNNAMRSGRSVTFSTGPVIPPYRIHGRVFDWVAGQIVSDALVEVLRRSDSLPYVGMSDSTGQFAIGPLEEGRYFVRAIVDGNRNGELDANETWDSLTTLVRGVSPFVELLAAPRDSTGPRLLTVSASDSLMLSASFDRLLDPDRPIGAGSFRVQAADSSHLTVAGARTKAQYEAMRAARDSIARLDSTAKVTPVPGTVSPPRPSRRTPTRDVVILLDSLTPLQPGATYRVTAVNIGSLTGVLRTSDRVVTVPRADSTRAPGRP